MFGSAQVWKSTPLRLSVAIAALFAAVSLVSLAATFAIVRDNAQETLRTTLDHEMAGFRALPDAGAIADLVQSQSRGTSPDYRLLSYLTPDGEQVGTAALPVGEEGYRAIAFDDDDEGRAGIDGDYLALTETVHGGVLTVAVSAELLDDLGEAFLSVFLFSLVPTAVLVIGGGVLLARRSARRLAGIEATLDRLTSGDFAARVDAPSGHTDDLGRIGGRINRMADAQERQIASLRQVSTDIAHDLKTPIQRVTVLLDKLSARPELSDPSRELADQAVAETRGIVQTFQALLQIAQIEGGSARNRFADVDLGGLARTFCEVYEPAAEDSGHRLSCNVADASTAVAGDKALLGQVFANLIENALRHAPAGGDIEVGVSAGSGTVRLVVADSGPGIPEGERENVLRRLYRLERSRTTPGSGLGLSLVAAIVDLHEGRLALEDNGPGLRVVIEFAARTPSRASSRPSY